MKSNIITTVTIFAGLSLFLASCKKGMDSSFAEEHGKAYFPISSALLLPQERPFKGRITGSFVSTPTSNPALYNSVANASGNVTHLGVFNKVTGDVINIVSSTVDGTFIMTNQSGEQIKGMYNGTFSFGAIPGTLSWDLNATITGGTGRFSAATGQFVFLATGDYVIEEGIFKGDYIETFDGTIIY